MKSYRNGILTLALASLMFLTVNQNVEAYKFRDSDYRFYICEKFCTTAYPKYKWGDRLDDGNSTLKEGWQNAVSSFNSKQTRVRFGYSSSSNNELNSFYESSSTLYGKYNVSFDSQKYVTSFFGYLNAGNQNITKKHVAQSTGVHELGHIVGLDHVSGTAIMNNKRERTKIYQLQTDDINGIIARYPKY